MKKETKKLIGFEETLVNNYRHYLESLENLATGIVTFSPFTMDLEIIWLLV